MKSLVVTGISNEQSFSTGKSIFVLILNDDIRIPISEELANKVLSEIYEEETPPQAAEAIPEIAPSSDYEDDDGIDQI